MTKTMGGDILGYWRHSFTNDYDFSAGTRFVTSLTKIFSDLFGFNIVNTLLFYNIFGVVALLLLGNILLGVWPYRNKYLRKIPYIILLIPGMSFWTSVIGKDSLAFFAACLALYASIIIKKRYLLFLVAISVMFVVRPHMSAVMLFSMALSLIFEKKLPFLYKLSVILIISIISVVLIPFALNYSGVGEAQSVAEVTDYIENRQSYNQQGGGGLDISSMSVPEQFFAYLFRPLFFDAPGVLGVIVSFENLFILILFLLFFIRGIKRVFINRLYGSTYNIIFLTLGLAILAITTANLGIAIRQKTMILPSFFYLITLSAYYIKKSKKTHSGISATPSRDNN